VRYFASSASLAITRYTSLPCARCNTSCFCNLNALFTVYFVSYTRLIILHIDCILVFVVHYFLFVFFLYHSLTNKVAQFVHSPSSRISGVGYIRIVHRPCGAKATKSHRQSIHMVTVHVLLYFTLLYFTVTKFRSVSIPPGFRRHLVGKTLKNACYCNSA